MTKSSAGVSDNGGRCEICNSEESIHARQSTVDAYCGGGLGWSQMWACAKCKPKHERLTKARADLKIAEKEVQNAINDYMGADKTRLKAHSRDHSEDCS